MLVAACAGPAPSWSPSPAARCCEPGQPALVAASGTVVWLRGPARDPGRPGRGRRGPATPRRGPRGRAVATRCGPRAALRRGGRRRHRRRRPAPDEVARRILEQPTAGASADGDDGGGVSSAGARSAPSTSPNASYPVLIGPGGAPRGGTLRAPRRQVGRDRHPGGDRRRRLAGGARPGRAVRGLPHPRRRGGKTLATVEDLCRRFARAGLFPRRRRRCRRRGHRHRRGRVRRGHLPPGDGLREHRHDAARRRSMRQSAARPG